jgi:hypothetical protein
MGNKAVDPRSHIDMFDWSVTENLLRDVEILMKIVTAGHSALAVEVVQARVIWFDDPRITGRRVQGLNFMIVPPEPPQPFEARIKRGWVDTERS